MKLGVKGNINYSAQIVEIKETHSLENADNIIGTNILGNHVIVSKDTQVGDTGIYFPVESALSSDYLKYNNLYRDKTLNNYQEQSGFFENKGRVRAVKLRGHRSEGLFMPLDSVWYITPLYFDDFRLGDQFDYINDIKVCEKYVIPVRQHGQGGGNKKGKKAKISRIVKDQFRFHQDTEQLGRNLDRFNLDDEIQISIKVHGTSAISSNIL